MSDAAISVAILLIFIGGVSVGWFWRADTERKKQRSNRCRP